jgi:hypothetical protein
MRTRRELLAGFAALPFFARAAVVLSFPRAKGESHTMDQRINVVTLGVKDLAVSKKFYVDGLGWKPVFENKEIIFFQTGGMVFALFLRDLLAEDFGADPKALGRAPMALGYNVRLKSEVDPLIQRARSAGATILTPQENNPGEGTLAISPTPTDSRGRWLGTPRGDWRLTAAWSSAHLCKKRAGREIC